MEETLKEFARLTGKAAEDGIKECAKSAAKQLAMKTQPFGLTAGKGKTFEQNIGRQVDQVYFGVNLGAYPATGSIKDAHYDARRNGDRPGRVKARQFRKERGQKWLGLIDSGQRDDYKVKQQAKAGRVKGAWIEAGNSLALRKAPKVVAWISRHTSGGYGGHSKTGEGMSVKIVLENRTPYAASTIYPKDIAKAMADGLKNGFKFMQKKIEGEIKKANAQ